MYKYVYKKSRTLFLEGFFCSKAACLNFIWITVLIYLKPSYWLTVVQVKIFENQDQNLSWNTMRGEGWVWGGGVLQLRVIVFLRVIKSTTRLISILSRSAAMRRVWAGTKKKKNRQGLENTHTHWKQIRVIQHTNTDSPCRLWLGGVGFRFNGDGVNVRVSLRDLQLQRQKRFRFKWTNKCSFMQMILMYISTIDHINTVAVAVRVSSWDEIMTWCCEH